MRSGELHLPSYICGPAAKAEMEFWGITPNKIEQCCWMNYNEWNSTQEALKRLEHDRKSNLSPVYNSESISGSAWSKLRPFVWTVLNRTNSCLAAKIVGLVSLLFVILSIFSFLAETTKPFEYYVQKPERNFQNVTSLSENKTTSDNFTHPVSNATVATEIDVVNHIKVKHPALYCIDLICLIYFLSEYILRFIFAPRKLKYVVSLLAVIDLCAILPDLIELLVYHIRPDLRADVDAVNYITILRVMRVLRIFRLVRHSPGLWILVYTLRASFSELVLLVWFVGIGILVFSSLIYYVEKKEDFESIPSGFWWALITMTTVGYGDMYPRSWLGKVVGSVCAMSGVLMIGFTVPALVNNFMLYYRHVQFAVFCEQAEGAHGASDHSTDDASVDTADGQETAPLTSAQCGTRTAECYKNQNGGRELAPLMSKLNV